MTEEEHSEEINSLKQEWINQFKTLEEDRIVQQLEQNPLEKILDDPFYNDLKSIATDKKTPSYLESCREDVQDAIGYDAEDAGFPIEKYKDLTQKRIAQEMADFAVYNRLIIPVFVGDKNERRVMYKYDKDNGVWKEFSKNQVGTLCKELSGKLYGGHISTEFNKNLYNHHECVHVDELGLDEDKILLDDKKILDISSKPYKTRSVKPTDRALYKFNVEYNPSATCPRFEEFVETLLDGEEKQIKTLQEFMGYLLKFPNRDYQRALIILGVSNSGKSQLADVLTELFSNSAFSNLSMTQIGNEKRYHVNKLGYNILNIDRDMSSSQIESEDTVKQVISQERLSVEPKGHDTYDIQPVAKHFVCSNVSPNPQNANDAAFYNRFLTLKAPNPVPKEDRVKNFGKKVFEDEGSGILNWMLKGLERLEEQGGFTLEPSGYETKMMWMEYGNSVSRFLWQCTEKADADYKVPTGELYRSYEEWIDGKLMNRRKKNMFVHEVSQQPYIEKGRSSERGAVFEGVRVKEEYRVG